MQFDDVVRVKQVVGAGNANGRLKEGWKLLAVVPATFGTSSNALYVLGKTTHDDAGEDDDKEVPFQEWV